VVELIGLRELALVEHLIRSLVVDAEVGADVTDAKGRPPLALVTRCAGPLATTPATRPTLPRPSSWRTCS
jgi:hypothetical protein